MQTKIRAIALILVFSILVAISSAENKLPVKVEGFDPDVPNLIQLREKIYTGGQPTVDGMRRLADLGIEVVINLRPHDESGARDESVEAESYGMKYVNIPITAETFTEEKVVQFRELMKDEKNYPMFIHCKSGNRAGAAWLAYRVQYENADLDASLREARAVGMQPVLEPVVLKLLE